MAPRDDPFARRSPPDANPATASLESVLDTGSVSATPVRGLARRDQDARSEDVFEPSGPNWVPFEWARRTSRMRALVSALAGGAVVSLATTAWHAVAVARRTATIVSPRAQALDEASLLAAAPPPARETATPAKAGPAAKNPQPRPPKRPNRQPAAKATRTVEAAGKPSTVRQAVKSVGSTPASKATAVAAEQADAEEPVATKTAPSETESETAHGEEPVDDERKARAVPAADAEATASAEAEAVDDDDLDDESPSAAEPTSAAEPAPAPEQASAANLPP